MMTCARCPRPVNVQRARLDTEGEEYTIYVCDGCAKKIDQQDAARRQFDERRRAAG